MHRPPARPIINRRRIVAPLQRGSLGKVAPHKEGTNKGRTVIMSGSISRRSFIAGSAAVAAAVGSLASVASADETVNQTTALVDHITPGSMKDMTTGVDITFHPSPQGTVAFVADPIPADQIAATEDFDVVVCGLGLAGMSAALSCALNGLSVVAVEKTSVYHTRGHDIGCLDSKLIKESGIEFDRQDYIDTAVKEQNYRCNYDLWKTWANFSGEAVDWLQDVVAGKITLQYNYLGTAKTNYSGIDTWNDQINIVEGLWELMGAMEQIAGENGAQFRYETAASQLVTDADGRVCGVVVKDPDGNYVQLNAARGVVLCTGGYENNWDLMEKYLRPEDLCCTAWRLETTENTGDGILMGQSVGGILDPFPHVLMKDPGGSMVSHANSKGLSLPFVRVNEAGHRFVNESMSPNFMSNAFMRQAGGHDFAILAGPSLAECVASTNYNTRAQSAAKMSPEELEATMVDICVTADTVEELAEKCGIDATNLKATLDRVTELYYLGEDVDWGSDAKMFMDYSSGPYYALEEGGAALVTVSGLRVTDKSEVVDKKGLPIPGLYATGNCSGDMFSDSYPHDLNGISHGRCLVFGYLLGARLAGNEKLA